MISEKNLHFSKTNFHQGTVRSGEYLDSPGDLLILGDVNPGAKVSAEGNIIIWGRLLGIAHAGSKATYAANACIEPKHCEEPGGGIFDCGSPVTTCGVRLPTILKECQRQNDESDEHIR